MTTKASSDIPEPALEARHIAENMKECGNRHFQKGRFNSAVDCYEAAARKIGVALDACNQLRQYARAGYVKYKRAERTFESESITLFAQIHSNLSKAFSKLERWSDARAAAATARQKLPEFKPAIKAGASAALSARDVHGSEWDSLRQYAARFPTDGEAQQLVAAWEQLHKVMDQN